MSKNDFTDEENIIIDKMIESRRSIRSFKSKMPPDDYIKKIIHAGMMDHTLTPGKFGFNSCLISYPQEIPPAPPRPDPEKVTTWIE